MVRTREELFQTLLDSYRAYYDITLCEESDAPLRATAVFHMHGTQYILMKAAQVWSADCNEYMYIFSVPHLSKDLYEQCLARALKESEPLIQPKEGHMSSYVIALFLCDTCDADAAKALRKCRMRKSFQFSLKGWMEVHTAMVELGKDSVVANFDGNKTAKFLKSVLHPKPRRRSLFRRK